MIIIASQNEHKVAEIRSLPAARDLELRAISDFADPPDVVEDGTTFEENAVIKAVRYSLWLRRAHGVVSPVIAEDAGLTIESEMGWPGIKSARIADTNERRIALVLETLGNHGDHKAAFVAITALAVNGRLVRTWRGIAKGLITKEPRGTGGFGYDPIFEDIETGETFAEMGTERKNERSHRTKSWTAALTWIKQENLDLSQPD